MNTNKMLWKIIIESKWYKILRFLFAAVCSAATYSVVACIAAACSAVACNAAACIAGACCAAVRGVAACIAAACGPAAACNAVACNAAACSAAACSAIDSGAAACNATAWSAASCGITHHWTPCMHNHTQPRHTAHWQVWACAAVRDSTMLQASTVEWIILTKMFTYELITFILIINYETF